MFRQTAITIIGIVLLTSCTNTFPSNRSSGIRQVNTETYVLTEFVSEGQGQAETSVIKKSKDYCERIGKQAVFLQQQPETPNGYSAAFECLPPETQANTISRGSRSPYIPLVNLAEGIPQEIRSIGDDTNRIIIKFNLGKNLSSEVTKNILDKAKRFIPPNECKNNYYQETCDDIYIKLTSINNYFITEESNKITQEKKLQEEKQNEKMEQIEQKSPTLRTITQKFPGLKDEIIETNKMYWNTPLGEIPITNGIKVSRFVSCLDQSKDISNMQISKDRLGIHLTGLFKEQLFSIDFIDTGKKLTSAAASIGTQIAINEAGAHEILSIIISSKEECVNTPSHH